MDYNISCPRCNIVFNSTRNPIYLQCSHIFCRPCINELNTDYNSNPICPICSCSSLWNNILDNERNKELLNLISPIEKTSKIRECSECDKKCTTSCQDCDNPEPICKDCFSLMHQTTKRQNHNIGPLIIQRKCSLHKKNIELYCVSCDECICYMCISLGPHKKHTVISPEETLTTYQSKLPEIIQSINERYELSKQRILCEQIKLLELKRKLDSLQIIQNISEPIEFVYQCDKLQIIFPIELRVLMLGLNNSGKTRILYTLIDNECNYEPRSTIGFNTESIIYNNYKLCLWDVGGSKKIRPLWRHYYQNTDVIIFVVDSSDWSNIDIAKEELHKTMCADILQNTPLLILANKQDINSAFDVETLVERLGLQSIQRKWFIHSCCGYKKETILPAIEWLTQLNSR